VRVPPRSSSCGSWLVVCNLKFEDDVNVEKETKF
jgi:hypothetical protein